MCRRMECQKYLAITNNKWIHIANNGDLFDVFVTNQLIRFSAWKAPFKYIIVYYQDQDQDLKP